MRIGMALRSHYGDAGRAIWDEWSTTSEKFDPKTQERVWRSFRGSGVSVGTIFHLAGTCANVA
jgi:putative DNA primase/helicase